MNIFSLVERVFTRLAVLPGLGFLQNYVTEFRGKQAEIQQRVGLYRGYVASARGAADEVHQAARGAKKEEQIDDDEPEDVYDDENDESYMQ